MPGKFVSVLLALAFFFCGYLTKGWIHKCPERIETKVEYVDRVQTEIEYVPKVIYKDGSKEESDIDLQLGKQNLNVKVNGKDFTISKQENEKYIFDNNKLTLTQNSSADLHISVPTVDKTRRWGIGVGISKDGAAGLLRFPTNIDNVGGWVAGNKKNVMCGVEVRF